MNVQLNDQWSIKPWPCANFIANDIFLQIIEPKLYFIMALRMREILQEVGIEEETAPKYEKLWNDNGIILNNIDMLDSDMLSEIGISVIGHQISILKISKQQVSIERKPIITSMTSAKPPIQKIQNRLEHFRAIKQSRRI